MIHEASEEIPRESDWSSCRCREHDAGVSTTRAEREQVTTAEPTNDYAES
jgi:hypothetical protein